MNSVHVALIDFYKIWYITSLLTLEKQVSILSHIGVHIFPVGYASVVL
jgi:hypothetical protein